MKSNQRTRTTRMLRRLGVLVLCSVLMAPAVWFALGALTESKESEIYSFAETESESSGTFNAPTVDWTAAELSATARTASVQSFYAKHDSELQAIASELTVGTIVANVTGPSIDIKASPNERSATTNSLTNPNANGAPLVFQATSEPTNSGWIEVLLPTRPNGSKGWIKTAEVSLTQNPFRIEVNRTDKTLTVFKNNQPHSQTEIATGASDTPTPSGAYYLTELLKVPDPTGIYGPYAFGLAAHSDHLTLYNGGSGTIGLHGTDTPEDLGKRVSHGCIRVSNETITELAELVPLGTPIVISGEETLF